MRLSKIELEQLSHTVLLLERATQSHDKRRKPGTIRCGLCISRDNLRIIVKRLQWKVVK